MSDTLFDNLRRLATNTINTVMGDNASWTPSAGGSAITAKVLTMAPDALHEVGDANYMPGDTVIDYKLEDLTGLYEAVRSGATEVITVDGVNYNVRSVKADVDGKCYLAYLEKVID